MIDDFVTMQEFLYGDDEFPCAGGGGLNSVLFITALPPNPVSFLFPI